jgi:hypothetical protein
MKHSHVTECENMNSDRDRAVWLASWRLSAAGTAFRCTRGRRRRAMRAG